MSPLTMYKVCRRAGCGALAPQSVGYCERHAAERAATRNRSRRQNASPRRREQDKVYADPRWAAVRAAAIERDGACVRCGSGEDLTVDHIYGWEDEEMRFDVEGVQVLCRTCHGRKDGARSGSAS